MKIWFDVLTPKQVLFFEPIIRQLQRKNQVFCTSRNYREAIQLAKIRNLKLVIIGKHGGAEKYGKLSASVQRMDKLSKVIQKFAPKITISFCSPEASRVSYGLGIPHIAFSNAPHAEAVLKLCLPLTQKLLTPWIIPKKEFSKYGIPEKDIIHYKALDESVIVKNSKKIKTKKGTHKKTILFRTYESQAAYIIQTGRKISIESILNEIVKKFPDHKIVVMGRYSTQIKQLKKRFGKKIFVLDKVVDSQKILAKTDVFVGSGGTMTQESALRGIPTISYNIIPGYRDEKFLVKKGLVKIEKNPKKIVLLIEKYLNSNKTQFQKKAEKILSEMEDPYPKLLETIRSVLE